MGSHRKDYFTDKEVNFYNNGTKWSALMLELSSLPVRLLTCMGN